MFGYRGCEQTQLMFENRRDRGLRDGESVCAGVGWGGVGGYRANSTPTQLRFHGVHLDLLQLAV